MLSLLTSILIGPVFATSTDARLNVVERLVTSGTCELALDESLIALSPVELDFAAQVERRITGTLFRSENEELYGNDVWREEVQVLAREQVSTLVRFIYDSHAPWTEEYLAADKTNLGEMVRLRPVRLLLALFHSIFTKYPKFENATEVHAMAKTFARLFVPISRELLAKPPKKYDPFVSNLNLFAKVSAWLGHPVPHEWPAVAYWSEHLDVINNACAYYRELFGREIDREPSLVLTAPNVDYLAARAGNDLEYVTSLRHRTIDLPRLRALFRARGHLSLENSLKPYVSYGKLHLTPLLWEKVLSDALRFHALDWIIGEVVRDVGQEFADHLTATMVRLHSHWREASKPNLRSAFDGTWNPREAYENYRAQEAHYKSSLDARAHNEERIEQLEAGDRRAFALFDRRSHHRQAFVTYLALTYPEAFSERSTAHGIVLAAACVVFERFPLFAINMTLDFQAWWTRQKAYDEKFSPRFREWAKFAYLTVAASEDVIQGAAMPPPAEEWRPPLVSRRDRRYFK